NRARVSRATRLEARLRAWTSRPWSGRRSMKKPWAEVLTARAARSCMATLPPTEPRKARQPSGMSRALPPIRPAPVRAIPPTARRRPAAPAAGHQTPAPPTTRGGWKATPPPPPPRRRGGPPPPQGERAGNQQQGEQAVLPEADRREHGVEADRPAQPAAEV